MELVIGEWIKNRRRRLGLTQEGLAKRANCSVHTVRKIETGDLRPSQELAREIARALEVPEEQGAEFVRFARTSDATAAMEAFTERGATASAGHEKTAEPPPPPVRFEPPAPLTAALGREQEAVVIGQLLRLPAVRLATLTGPPGTGKTRLSLMVANEVKDEFEHGAASVALAPLARDAAIENAIAQTLGVKEMSNLPPLKALTNFLKDKQLLLVLDNFEHLLKPSTRDERSGDAPAATFVVTELLTHAPRLKILATSREPLRVYGERELPVQPLKVPPLTPVPPWRELETYAAVQLFVERAQAAKPDFELTAQNGEAVARLCVGLDGLPLAIEMAAARVKWETPEALLPKLTRRLNVFKSGARDHAPRQQTLRGAIAWSYELLDATEQRVLRHLGVFRGSFSESAANAVCDTAVGPILESLLEKSLVKREDEELSRMILLETIREFALEELEAAGEAESVFERHWAFYTAVTQKVQTDSMRGPLEEAVPAIRRELDNVQSALDWALDTRDAPHALTLGVALSEYWYATHGLTEALPKLVRVLALSQKLGNEYVPARARVRIMYAEFLRMSGDFTGARPLLEEAIADWRRIGEAGNAPLGFALLALARLTVWQGDETTARASAREALDIFGELGDASGQASALRRLGECALSRREYAEARAFLDRALTLDTGNGKIWGQTVTLLERGDIARAEGDYELARRDYDASNAVNAGLKDSMLGQRLEHRLGVMLALEGDPERGTELLEKSLQDHIAQGNEGAVLLIHSGLALAAAMRGQPKEAMHWLEAMEREMEVRKLVLIGGETTESKRALELVKGMASDEELEGWRAERLFQN